MPYREIAEQRGSIFKALRSGIEARGFFLLQFLQIQHADL